MEFFFDILSIHKQREREKKKSVKCDPTVQINLSTTLSEITVPMTLVTVVLLREEKNDMAYP